MRYPGDLMECALCLSRRSVHGSPAMGLRPKVGPGQGTAKVILPAPVYWDYAKAGRRSGNLPIGLTRRERRVQPRSLADDAAAIAGREATVDSAKTGGRGRAPGGESHNRNR